MKKIIVAATHPGGARVLEPVIKKLKKELGAEVKVFSYLFSADIFQKTSLDFYAVSNKRPLAESVREILEKETPDLILVGTGVQTEKVKLLLEQEMTCQARGKGIKTVAVLDMWGSYKERFSGIFPPESFKFLPDKITLIDKKSREDMLGIGFPRGILEVTGSPYFEELSLLAASSRIKNMREEARQKLDVDASNFLILFASQPIKAQFGDTLGFDENDVLEEFLRESSRLRIPDMKIVVKLHPRQADDAHANLLKNHSGEFLVIKNFDNLGMVAASDMVVGAFSTLLVEAACLGRPAFSLQPGLKTADLLLTNFLGVTIPVYKKGELAEMVENFANNPERKNTSVFLSGQAGSADRIIGLIRRLI